MPELPFLTVLVENLRPKVVGRTIRDVLVPSASVLKTYDPPIGSVVGRRIAEVRLRGKVLVFDLPPGLAMCMHLMRNGRLQIVPAAGGAGPAGGAGRAGGGAGPLTRTGRRSRDVALVLALDDGAELRLIELGPKKAASVWLFRAGEEGRAEPLTGLGVEPLSAEFTPERLARMLGEQRAQLKHFLTLQRYLVGIGNAYADEILWEARLSPQAATTVLTRAEVDRLHAAVGAVLRRAITAHREAFAGALPIREPPELLAVHRHGKEPCPRCGSPIAVIYYEDRETYYCPACQTGGKVYADRRRSRLLR